MSAGWQQAPVPVVRKPMKCPHLGLMFAALTIAQHREGHRWVCPCGARFAVVSDLGQNKRLVPDWRPAPTDPAQPEQEGS